MSNTALNLFSDAQVKGDHDYFSSVLETGKFSLYAQHQWSMDLKTLLGTELLFRLPRVNSEQLYSSTAYWIELAESKDKLDILTYAVVDKVLRNAALLNPLHAPYFINVPPPIISVQFVDYLVQGMMRAGLPFDFIGIELTERQPVVDKTMFRLGIEKLHMHKVLVALDDYGRGYATMTFLRDVTVDRVKIDRGLLHDARVNLSKRLTLVSLLDFALEFEIDVIAEGVETETDFIFADRLGCKGIQGFYRDSPKLLIPVDA